MLFCDASRTTNFDLPQPQNGPRSPKSLAKKKPSAHYFFGDLAADGRKHSAKMRELEISKNIHFCNVHFSLGKKHMFVKPCLKTHAFLVHPLGVSFDFLHTPTMMLTDTQKGRGAQTKKIARNLAPASFRVLRDERGPGPAGHPVDAVASGKRETIRKSHNKLVIVTANVMAESTEEAIVYVQMLNMFQMSCYRTTHQWYFRKEYCAKIWVTSAIRIMENQPTYPRMGNLYSIKLAILCTWWR